MNVLVIEDEKPAADKLERMLQVAAADVTVLGRLQSVLESINWLNENVPPDLIFMDVQLDDGVCFEIFDAIKVKTPVIFTTAYDEYAIRAFEVNSVDYLLKPITPEALKRSIDKYRSLFETAGLSNSKLPELSGLAVKNYKSRFFVKLGNHFHSIPTDQIDCFFIRERATLLSCGTKHYDVDYSLDQVQALVDPGKFFRINRNFLVHIDFIGDIYKYSSSRLGIKLGDFDRLDLIVSRERVVDFKKWLDR